MSALKFLGCTVRAFQSSANYNMSGPSQLNVSLVEDLSEGDLFSPGQLFAPVYFEAGQFEFNGILQKYAKREAQEGYPTYEVVILDPRELLDGVRVILGGYSGATNTVENLVNVYGYYEAQAYGLSQSDETGMPWFLIKTALTSLLNSPLTGTYGGSINYRGYRYGIDFSLLPIISMDYRVGQSSMSLLELISQVCDDHGCDFLTDLVGTTIRIRPVSRRSQPSLNTLAALTEASRGVSLVRAETGIEGRNEITSTFLSGGEVRVLHQTTSATSFWGLDAVGNPILGSPVRLDLTDPFRYCFLQPGLTTGGTAALLLDFTTSSPEYVWDSFLKTNSGAFSPFELVVGGREIVGDPEIIRVTADIGGGTYSIERGLYDTTPRDYNVARTAYLHFSSINCEYMNLNASPVSDLIGSLVYPCTTFELRLLKSESGIYGWAAYLQHYRPQIAALLGLLPPFVNKGGARRPLPQDLVNDSPLLARGMAGLGVNADAWSKILRFYEFLKSYADEYMGKKFAVALPLVLHKQNAETLRISTSYEVDEGGWLEEGSTPLGLSLLNQDVFKLQDGRFRAFARYENPVGADFSMASPGSTVLEDNEFYTSIEVDQNLIYTPTPAAVVTVNNPLFDTSLSWMGDPAVFHAVFQMSSESAQPVLQSAAYGNIGVKVSPAHRSPSSFAVPLKSNTEVYGPWFATGAPGKVHHEQDQSLVPWNYGGFTLMNAVALARTEQASRNALVVESGNREEVGLPTASLGDVLINGGPQITGIQVQYGDRGFTTSYSFATFTPFNRSGIYSRQQQERLRRISIAQTQLRRSGRAAVRGAVAQVAQQKDGALAHKEFFRELPKAVKKQSPHDMLVAHAYADNVSETIRTGVASITFEEAVGGVNADDDAAYARTAAMSWNGLLRPFSTAVTAPSGLPAYGSATFTDGIDRSTLNPWKASNDIEILANGDSYTGLHVTKWGGDNTNARPLGLRGPLSIVGFGYDTEGKPVPSNGAGGFSADHLTNPHGWKAGPADLLWDERRGVWTCHDVLKGVSQREIVAGGSGNVTVYAGSTATSWVLNTHNWGASAIESGAKVNLLFNVLDKAWYAVGPGSGNRFHEPEFIVASGLVSANWGSGILPVGYVAANGSGERFARYDHVHQHPVMPTGDLHPEYALPSGLGSSYYLERAVTGDYSWQPLPVGGTGGSVILAKKGAAVANTCLYDAVSMGWSSVNGSGCCWSSGTPIYLHLLSPTFSGTYLPAAYAGTYNSRSVYWAMSDSNASPTICSSGETPGSGIMITACGVCAEIPSGLTMSVNGYEFPIYYIGDSHGLPAGGHAWTGSGVNPYCSGTLYVAYICNGTSLVSCDNYNNYDYVGISGITCTPFYGDGVNAWASAVCCSGFPGVGYTVVVYE